MSNLGIQSRQFDTGSHGGFTEFRLTQLLARVRRRLWIVDLARGTCWGLLAATLTLLAGMWLDLVWELPSEVRISTWICAAIIMFAALGRLLSLTWHRIEARRLARQIDTATDSRGEILNGFEFAAVDSNAATSATRKQHSSNDSLSGALAEIAIARAARLAEPIQSATVISQGPAMVAARTLATAVAVIAGFAFVCPTLARTEWQRFSRPWDDTPPYSPYEISVEPGNADVIYGQGLEVRVKIGGPSARNVQLLVTTNGKTETVPLFPEPNGTWRTSLSRLTEETTYRARVERARSPTYQIHIITTPAIEDVKFVVTPPPYTRDAQFSGPLPKNGLSGLAGTRVTVTARSNRPLLDGKIVMKSNTEVEDISLSLKQPGESEVSGEFTISRNAKFELHLRDTDGQSSQEPFIGSITLLIDQRPLVRILEPKPQSLATPTTLLPVIIDSEDDYGLSRVELFRSLNDSRPMPTSLPLPDPPPRRYRDQSYLPLARYDLQPGDEIKLFARVTDNEPDNPKGAESSVVVVRIISQTEFERMLRMREGLEVLVSKYQQAERRLESLAEELEKLQKDLEQAPADSPLAEELKERLEKLAKEMHDEAEAIANAADHDLPYDIDQNLKQKLKDLANDLKKHGDELEQLAEDSEDKPDINNEAVRRQLQKLAKQLKERKEQFDEEATDPLELLAKVFPLMEDQSRYTALVLWQTDLAERLASFKGIEQSDEPAAKARLRDLQDEQRRVREELQKLFEDIQNHVTQLPDDEQFDQLRDSATKFVKAVSASGAQDEMNSAESVLADFRGDAGYQHAHEAAEILKKFLGKCEGMGSAGGMCLKFSPSLSDSLGNTIDQLLAEAGLSMSQGSGNSMGQGSRGRGGYGMRSGNRNVGLYGGLDMLGGKAGGTGGGPISGRSASGKSTWNDGSTESTVTAPWRRSASTVNTGPLPPQYRRRVNQYFQRVVTELEAAGQ